MDFNEALMQNLTERQVQTIQSGGKVARIYSRKNIEQAFLETFELVGGIPRLAIWANDPENYGTFLQLMMKLAPKESKNELMGQIIEYRSNIPHSPLNDVAPVAERVEQKTEE